MESIDIINKRLKDYFGKSLDGRPNFRIMWSTNEKETRIGDYNVFYGKIFIRREPGAKVVAKYPFNKDRWVLERLIYERNPEILSSENGTYEPLYFFEDSEHNPLPVIWNAVEYAVTTVLFGEKTKVHKSGEAEEADKEVEADTKYFEDYLGDRPELGLQMQFGEAVSFAGMKRRES